MGTSDYSMVMNVGMPENMYTPAQIGSGQYSTAAVRLRRELLQFFRRELEQFAVIKWHVGTDVDDFLVASACQRRNNHRYPQ